MSEENARHVCANCRWRSDEFTSVCVNDESERLADFVSADNTCPKWQCEVDNDDLWPCPFCGGEAEMMDLYQGNEVVNTNVMCHTCGVNLNRKNHREAVEAWNSRSGGLVSWEEMERGGEDDD